MKLRMRPGAQIILRTVLPSSLVAIGSSARAAATDRELRSQQAQLQALDATKLRSIASHYVVAFLQAVQRLLEGTGDANPAANGETIADERREQGIDD